MHVFRSAAAPLVTAEVAEPLRADCDVTGRMPYVGFVDRSRLIKPSYLMSALGPKAVLDILLDYDRLISRKPTLSADAVRNGGQLLAHKCDILEGP